MKESKSFEFGTLYVTNGVQNVIDHNPINAVMIYGCLQRHLVGDWGNLCEEDKQANDDAVENGGRLLSAYEVGEEKVKIWIITESDRSATTILLPEEY